MVLEHIARDTGIRIEYLERVVRSASHRYKQYYIAKRAGGYRSILHPAKEVKVLQRWVARRLLSQLPIHSSAFAYRVGKDCAAMARLHVDRKYLLRVDFKDFFPSITGGDIANILTGRCFALGTGQLALDPYDVFVIRKIVCRNDRLVIGAPSSPVLSNAIMYEFDRQWNDRCCRSGVLYTRYADDIYMSTNAPNALPSIYEDFLRCVSELREPRLQVNREKTVFSSDNRRKMILGLIVTPTHTISLGRAKKRAVRSLVHRILSGNASAAEISYAAGFFAYTQAVEPQFLFRLERKFGVDILQAISKAGNR